MKRILLSLATVTALTSGNLLADTASDIAQLKAMMAEMNKRLAKLEAENKRLKSKLHAAPKHHSRTYAKKSEPQKRHVASTLEKRVEKLEKQTPLYAKTSKLKFSGRHYIGVVSKDVDGETHNNFETRRNYIQVKGYFFDNPKSYMRVTLDTHQVKDNGSTSNSGDWEVRLKYAYLYLDDLLPYTGVEFGQAHRPWIDYEEHHGWWYRSIAKTFVERKQDADFTNSADLGVNFKTKTDYFSSEIGLFNGEGYHGLEDGKGMSFEWRLTANLLGTGKKHVHKSDRYADLSFYGQYNTDYAKKGDAVTGDFIWYGFNAVYNQPEFLIAANYLKADEAAAKFKGDGWSVNGELRWLTFSPELAKWNTFARYDDYKLDNGAERKSWLAGIAYRWNKNVEFILNYTDDKDTRSDSADKETKAWMFTADVQW